MNILDKNGFLKLKQIIWGKESKINKKWHLSSRTIQAY